MLNSSTFNAESFKPHLLHLVVINIINFLVHITAAKMKSEKTADTFY